MTTAPTRLRLASSPTAPEPTESTDPRVDAVREVMAGQPLADVASRRGIEAAVLLRWTRTFVEAGTARLANRPEPELAQQRDRFLAAFAHELRTPLAVAQGWAAMLADGDLPPSMVESTSLKLDDALARLAARVRDVEHLAAASLGRLHATPELTTPRAIAAAAGLELAAGDACDLAMHTDAELASRALHDLWDAARLPPAPTAMRLVARRHAAWLELRIVRTADPIEPTVLQALFEPFDANDDGTGVSIGLYLARALAVVLGGTVGLEQHHDRGLFWLRIPLTDRTQKEHSP